MGLMQDKDRAAVQEVFTGLTRPVHLVLFTSAESGEYSDVARDLLTEVVDLHPQLSLDVVGLEVNAARAIELGVDKAPAIVMLGGSERADYGVRFFGVPGGYEFATLIEGIRLVGGASPVALQPATQAFLDELTTPMRLQVFATPTCPYCPRAVILAYQLALASPYVRADGVEVSEFPDLGDRYAVMGVPKTVIDELVHVEGAVPEGMLLERLREALVAEVSR